VFRAPRGFFPDRAPPVEARDFNARIGGTVAVAAR
jgi:hypothetical protein